MDDEERGRRIHRAAARSAAVAVTITTRILYTTAVASVRILLFNPIPQLLPHKFRIVCCLFCVLSILLYQLRMVFFVLLSNFYKLV